MKALRGCPSEWLRVAEHIEQRRPRKARRESPQGGQERGGWRSSPPKHGSSVHNKAPALDVRNDDLLAQRPDRLTIEHFKALREELSASERSSSGLPSISGTRTASNPIGRRVGGEFVGLGGGSWRATRICRNATSVPRAGLSEGVLAWLRVFRQEVMGIGTKRSQQTKKAKEVSSYWHSQMLTI